MTQRERTPQPDSRLSSSLRSFPPLTKSKIRNSRQIWSNLNKNGYQHYLTSPSRSRWEKSAILRKKATRKSTLGTPKSIILTSRTTFPTYLPRSLKSPSSQSSRPLASEKLRNSMAKQQLQLLLPRRRQIKSTKAVSCLPRRHGWTTLRCSRLANRQHTRRKWS